MYMHSPRQPFIRQYPQVTSGFCSEFFLNRAKVHLFLCFPKRLNQTVLVSKMDVQNALLAVTLPLKSDA